MSAAPSPATQPHPHCSSPDARRPPLPRFRRPFPSPVSSTARRGAAWPTRHAARPVRPPRRRPAGGRPPLPPPVSLSNLLCLPPRHAAAFHGRRNVTATCESVSEPALPAYLFSSRNLSMAWMALGIVLQKGLVKDVSTVFSCGFQRSI
ncbi:hypothetical protein ABZP36_026978 [Zizania latifolia]